MPPGAIAKGTGTRVLGRRFVDDANVTDHHAIIPTTTDPTQVSLDSDEQRRRPGLPSAAERLGGDGTRPAIQAIMNLPILAPDIQQEIRFLLPQSEDEFAVLEDDRGDLIRSRAL